jgi:hypothetical protein
MLIALLAVLGVDLIVIVVLLALLLGRRRWLGRQPGAFKGAIRVVDGDVDGLGPKWKRGYGRWVREVLVWTKAPLLLSSQSLAVDGLAGRVRAAEPGEVKRLGAASLIVALKVDGGGQVEIGTQAESESRALGPYTPSAPDSRVPRSDSLHAAE